MGDDEREWKQSMYEQAVSDPNFKSLAWQMAERLVGADDPELGAGDVEAARRYLRACMLNMSVYELQTVTTQELAGLLARGALGAARYRAAGTTTHSAGAPRRPPPRAR